MEYVQSEDLIVGCVGIMQDGLYEEMLASPTWVNQYRNHNVKSYIELAIDLDYLGQIEADFVLKLEMDVNSSTLLQKRTIRGKIHDSWSR